MTKRKKYTKEFKLDAISLVRDQNLNIAEASRNLGVSAQMLDRWIKEEESEDGQAFRGNGNLTPDQEEIRKLKAQVKRLEMEREQNFTTEKPNQAFVGDITYIWTAEGWLYLAVVIDLYSRKVVGWSMGSRMKAQLVCDALTMVVWQKNPDKVLIVHSDQGVQYASHQYRQLLSNNGFIGSMSKKGCCWDNAVAESFW